MVLPFYHQIDFTLSTLNCLIFHTSKVGSSVKQNWRRKYSQPQAKRGILFSIAENCFFLVLQIAWSETAILVLILSTRRRQPHESSSSIICNFCLSLFFLLYLIPSWSSEELSHLYNSTEHKRENSKQALPFPFSLSFSVRRGAICMGNRISLFPTTSNGKKKMLKSVKRKGYGT